MGKSYDIPEKVFDFMELSALVRLASCLLQISSGLGFPTFAIRESQERLLCVCLFLGFVESMGPSTSWGGIYMLGVYLPVSLSEVAEAAPRPMRQVAVSIGASCAALHSLFLQLSFGHWKLTGAP